LLRIDSFDGYWYTLFLVAAKIGFFLSTNQDSHLIDHSRVLWIKWKDDSVDAQHEADAEENDEVCFCLSEEHICVASHVDWEIIVGNPHIGKIEAQRQYNNAEEEE